MNKAFIIGIATIILSALFVQADAGIVVSYKTGKVETECVRTQTTLPASKLLEQSSFDPEFSENGPFGRLICKINETGENAIGNSCEFNGKFWAFYHNTQGKWNMAEVGADTYKTPDNSMIGFAFGDGSEALPEFLFDDICEKHIKIKRVAAITQEEREVVSEGELIRTAGKTLDLEITIENIGTGKMSEIRVIADIKKMGTNERDSLSSLNAGEFQKATLSLDLDEEEGEYPLTVEVNALDSKGNTHHDKILFFVEIRKKKHDIRIKKVEITSQTCDGNTTLDILLENRGRRDEKGKLTIQSTQTNELAFEIGEDESERVSIGTESTGTIIITAYDSKGEMNDQKSILLNARECQTDKIETLYSVQKNNKKTEPLENTPAIIIHYPKPESFETKWKRPFVTGLILAGYALAIALGIAFVVKTRRKSRNN